VQDIGGGARKHMKKKIKYTDEPIEFKVIPNFLPPPDQLVRKDESLRVTISLSKGSVDFFKKHARENKSHYQTMIRKVLDYYVQSHTRNALSHIQRGIDDIRNGRTISLTDVQKKMEKNIG
jgi:predicted DNA binding CopG/RHH family protein